MGNKSIFSVLIIAVKQGNLTAFLWPQLPVEILLVNEICEVVHIILELLPIPVYSKPLVAFRSELIFFKISFPLKAVSLSLGGLVL